MDHRQQVLGAAQALFYRRGVQAVGMDELRSVSGVPLKRIYQHFPSKEALVVAYLEARDDLWMTALTTHVESPAETPRDRLLAVFDWLETWFAEAGFHGCGFLNAFGELGTGSPPIADAARRHKDRLHSYLLRLTRELAAPDLLADQLLILIDGATAAAMLGRTGSAAAAKAAAAALLP